MLRHQWGRVMNRIYKTVWSAAQHCMVVVSELAKNARGTTAKIPVLVVMVALHPVITQADNDNLAFVGTQGPAALKANNNCGNDLTWRHACNPWGTTLTDISGLNFGYMSSNNSYIGGLSWAGDQSSGFSFGGLSKTYIASTSQVIAQKSGVTLNGDTITINSANGLNMSSKKITSLGPGSAATDAVNVGQLTPVINALGGGATFNTSSGVVTAPKYTLSKIDYTTVGDALNALDNGSAGLVKVAGGGDRRHRRG